MPRGLKKKKPADVPPGCDWTLCSGFRHIFQPLWQRVAKTKESGREPTWQIWKGWMLCSEHDADDADDAAQRELMVLELHCGNFSATALLNLEFASVMFLLSKVLQGHRGGGKDRSRKYCTHNGAFMLCSITKSAHSTRHRDHYQCEWVICDVHKQNDLHFISFSKQLCRDTECEALPAVTFFLCSVNLDAK